jgi:hypothetical protein
MSKNNGYLVYKFLIGTLLLSTVGSIISYNAFCSANPISFPKPINESPISINWGLVIATAALFIEIIVNWKKIIGSIYKLFKIDPLDIDLHQKFFPNRAMIKDPINLSYFHDYISSNSVFYNHDTLSINIKSNIDQTLRISPVIKIRILSCEEIKDFPVILFPHPKQPYGIGGGGELSAYFSSMLSCSQKQIDAIYVSIPNEKDPNFFPLTQSGMVDFQLDVFCQSGFYFEYQIGVEYRTGVNAPIQWIDKVFICGCPKAMRKWYFKDLGNHIFQLIKTNDLVLENEILPRG